MGCRGAVYWRVTLPRWQCWQSRHQAAISVDMPFHSQREVISRPVALMPGWANPWMAVKTAGRWDLGTSGRRLPVAVEQRSSWSLIPNLVICQALSLERAIVSVQFCCSAAMAARSTRKLGEDGKGRKLDTTEAEEEQAPACSPCSAALGREGSCKYKGKSSHYPFHQPLEGHAGVFEAKGHLEKYS